MLVACPKCKTRLKIADEKITPEGTRFKCPKCATVLLVKKPRKTGAPVQAGGPLDKRKALVAHGDPSVLDRARAALSKAGYSVIASVDGVDAMVKALKELPAVGIIDVALPKIFGFEVCKKLRERAETKGMRLILISSIYDKTRYRREPVSLYGADDYIDEHEIEDKLAAKAKGEAPPEEQPLETKHAPKPEIRPEIKPEPKIEAPKPAAPETRIEPRTAPKIEPPIAPKIELKMTPEAPKPEPLKPAAPKKLSDDQQVEKAKRLVRAILSDIYLYSAQKVEEAVKANKFREAFASELKEGLKLYEQRFSAETRAKGDFYNEEIAKFLETRKKSLGLI